MKNFKKGDKVVMFDCMEAKNPKNYGKIWECETDSFKRSSKSNEVVFLKGFSGSFHCRFLQLVKIQIMTEIKTHSSYIPLERKVKLIDWQGYIKAKLRELRGLSKHSDCYNV